MVESESAANEDSTTPTSSKVKSAPAGGTLWEETEQTADTYRCIPPSAS